MAFNNRGFNRGNFRGNNGGNRRGGQGTLEIKEGTGRAFPNPDRDERQPMAGGKAKVDGQVRRVSVFVNVKGADFTDKNAQRTASEIATEIAQLLADNNLTLGITIQDENVDFSRGNDRGVARPSSRPFRSSSQREDKTTPWDEEEEEDAAQDDSADEVEEEEEEVPAPKRRRVTAETAAPKKTKTTASKPAAKRSAKK